MLAGQYILRLTYLYRLNSTCLSLLQITDRGLPSSSSLSKHRCARFKITDTSTEHCLGYSDNREYFESELKIFPKFTYMPISETSAILKYEP